MTSHNPPIPASATPRKRALITGISGQDGSHLREILVAKNYEVHGLRRASSRSMNEMPRCEDVDDCIVHIGDIMDQSCVTSLLRSVQFDEIYHLAAQSHVGISFDHPLLTCDVNAMGTLRILQAIIDLGQQESVRFYNATSSEMFGKVAESPQTEKTPFHPVSPYGVSKVFAYWMNINIRETYGLFAVNGILFNHESPRRGTHFVTRKISMHVARISQGAAEVVELGNLDARRDWGHSRDYMYGAYLMLQQDWPEDYVLATGETHSVREFAAIAFDVVGMTLRWEGKGLDEVGIETSTGKVRVRVNKAFFRPLELEVLLGSPEKAMTNLGWERTIGFKALVQEMVLADVSALNKSRQW